MGTMVKLTAADGHTFDAYRAEPARTSKGGLVILQEIFGVNAHMRSVCDTYASKGYTVVSPAVFDRVEKKYDVVAGPDTMGRGMEIAKSLDINNTLADIAAAAESVRAAPRGSKMAMMGFCFGGTMAAASAINLSDVFASAIGYYGGGIIGMLDNQPKIPLLLHFGKKDPSIPLKSVKKIRAGWTTPIIHNYPAGHAFNRDGSDAYHQASARKAQKRTLDFLALTLSQR